MDGPLPDSNRQLSPNARYQAKYRQRQATKLDRILLELEDLPEIKQTLREICAMLTEQRQNGRDQHA